VQINRFAKAFVNVFSFTIIELYSFVHHRKHKRIASASCIDKQCIHAQIAVPLPLMVNVILYRFSYLSLKTSAGR